MSLQGTGAARPKWQRFSRTCPALLRSASRAPAFSFASAVAGAPSTTPPQLGASILAERSGGASLASPACHEERLFGLSAACRDPSGARAGRGRPVTPYSLIQGIKWRKPTPARLPGRFHHQKGASSGTTRNKP